MPHRTWLKTRDISLSLLSGSLLALCLPKPGLCWLAWIAPAALIALWERADAKKAALLGLAAGMGFHAVALHWIYQTCRFAGVPLAVSTLALLLLSGFLALNWAAIAALGSWLSRSVPAQLRPWTWAAAWTASSYLWNTLTPRLAADYLSYTQWRHLSLIQIGAILGPYGLGFLIVAWNAALAGMLERKRTPRFISLALSALALLAAWGYGRHCLAQKSRFAASQPKSLAVSILQPDIDQYHKWDPAFAARIAGTLRRLQRDSARISPTLEVWPEASQPFVVDEDRPGRLMRRGVPGRPPFALLGAVSRKGLGPDVQAFNSGLLFSPAGALLGTYHKRRLVPFGEFVPIKALKRFIGILDQMGDMTPGLTLQPLLKTPLGLLAVTICYEATFPELSREDAARGARVIANLTNDGWYGDTWGPYQHFGTNVYRAVENRVYVLRAANTGISAMIDPWGGVYARLGIGETGVLTGKVPAADPFPSRSFYARHGDWLAWASLALVLLPAVLRLPRPGLLHGI